MIAHQRDENKTKYFIYKNIGSPLKSPEGPEKLEKVKRLTSLTALENTAQAQLLRLSPRNHCSNVLRSHWALEITARACFLAAGRSKSLLELAF